MGLLRLGLGFGSGSFCMREITILIGIGIVKRCNQ